VPLSFAEGPLGEGIHLTPGNLLPRAPKFEAVAAAALVAAPPGLYAGTSGWSYPTWKPGFYPEGVPARAFLRVYAARLTSVEVNFTFREALKEGQLEGWLASTPPGFRFAFKAPQSITHFKRLRECHSPVTDFVHSLEPARAAGKLGPLLFQLPPKFKANTALLNDLLAAPALQNPALQIAFEFRNETWFNQETYAVLHAHNAAMCVAVSDDLATPEIHTADFFCFRLRLHGGYKPAKLKAFAEKFAALSKLGETYVYFKHEDEPTGAQNAVAMLRHMARSKAVRP
jgi:uncharacterized protein YecE (DUF72 family)